MKQHLHTENPTSLCLSPGLTRRWIASTEPRRDGFKERKSVPAILRVDAHHNK
ncbi:hypothetical protein SXCC_04256 [Gluconacetobacter sp. SXCC-1]|nr:hypothetical protein SXCC_04256 [Gluconacetobacter sp. SXCC-1]